MTLSRRRYLAALGGSAGVALAGCGGGDVNRTTYEAESVSAPEEVSDYVSASSNFDGTPAITVSTGTTVTWRWTGRGNAHNVASQGGGPLNSSLTAEEGHTYDHTFEQSGVYLYKCNPHEFQGMKGAVVVE